jgi:L-threonylcarbamoyladenylate synthase
MKTVKLSDAQDIASIAREASAALERGGLVCLPCHGSYRILADITNKDAVVELFHSKHRVKKSPALIFIPDEKAIWKVAARVPGPARKLARQFWPGPLTLLVEPHDELPTQLTRQLETNRVGVRISDNPLIQAIVAELNRPVLVSSANRQRKAGASSPAQIRKNFMSKIALFVDAGDLQPGTASTVVEVDAEGAITVTRPGSITSEALAEAMTTVLAAAQASAQAPA